MARLLPGVIALVIVIGGCAAARRPEPGQIVLRNTGRLPVASMAVRDVAGATDVPVRLGEVAPLPAGARTVFRRRDDPPPLPDAALMRWRMGNGPEQTVRLDLAPLLRAATGRPGEALVSEIGPDGRVVARLEPFVP